MGVEWESGRTPTTGLATFDGTSGTEIAASQFLGFDPSAETQTVSITDETLTIPSSGRMQLGDDQIGCVPGDSTSLEVWSGLNGTGQQYTIITPDDAFSGAGSYECRWYKGTSFLEFSVPTQVAASTTLYATYNLGCTVITARWRARIHQEIRAAEQLIVSGVSTTITDTATAGEAIEEEFCYIDEDGVLNVLATGDLDNYDRMATAVYIDGSYSLGETVTIKYNGVVDAPAAAATLPKGRELWVGGSGLPTWSEDATNGLSASDYIKPFGVASPDGTDIILNQGQGIRGQHS